MSKVLVVDTLVHELPFSEAMNWETFQFFCTDLLSKRHKVTDVREYLTQGSKQDGIDIYATTGIDGKMITAQCKLEQYLSPKELDDIIELFLKGEFAVKSAEFILCTNFDLSKHREDEKNIGSAREKLSAVGVAFIVWDKNGLAKELRSNPAPDLLCRYFNMDVARAFYGPVYEDWYKDYRKIAKLTHKENRGYIARKLTDRKDYYESVNNPYHLYWNDRYVNLVNLMDSAKKPGDGKYLVLSIAGFGKTFEMDHVAAHYASDDQYLYPIKIYLRDYEGQSIPALLEMFCARWKDIEEQSLLLVLDGLDEMKEIHYQTFINHLNLFCDTAPHVKIIVSTRFNFYDLSNPPLRNFEILVLHAFNQKDIDDYITGILGTRKIKFLAAVKKYGFEDYLENPYYLSRLVRFYDEAPASFPASKPELFVKILFDLFDKDNSLNANVLTRTEFLRVSQKIAYCMTVVGKPFLTSVQMEKLLISADQLKLIKKYFLLNKNATSLDDWSFEHKNLQEYLCASFLQLLPLERLLEITTYPYNRQKIQTKFINTYSFLFALVNKESAQFKALLTWLTTNQQELLIRFEKGRIPRSTRLEIGKSILNYYRSENLSLFAASGFSLQELADFMEIDADVIAYVNKMIDEDQGDWYAYFGIDLIAHGAKGYIHKNILNTLLLKVLANAKFSARVHANTIDAFIRLNLFDRTIFDQILTSQIDLANNEIRNTLVLYLNSADFTEDYLDFLIATIPLFEQMENSHQQLGSAELLKKIILRSKRPSSIRKILDYVLSDQSTLSIEDSGDSKITAEEFKELMVAAKDLYSQDNTILDLVLSFYLEHTAITLYGEWLIPVLDFFEATAGLPQIFHRVYQMNLPDRQVMELAGAAECDFLLDEYELGKIQREEMFVFRNILSHRNRELFEYFYARLNNRFNNDFFIADKDFDYQELWKSYHTKNQQMLEDRSLFIKEVEDIFAVLGLDTVVKKDFHNYQDYKLHKFQQSIALGKLRLDADKIPRSKTEMISSLQDEQNWKYYKINEISRLLGKRKQEPRLELQPSLLSYAEIWIKEKILELDYLHCIKDNSQGTANFDRNVEANNDLYMKLEPDLDDTLLLKMIPSDFRGGIQHRDLSLSGVIITKVKDQPALKEAVFAYLKMNLAMYVQKTLFAICEKLNYTECLQQLYEFITTDTRLAGSDKNFLTDIYISLGGEVTDFKSFVLTVPQKEELYYLSWNWYLIEKLLDAEPGRMIELLKPVLTDSLQPESHQVLAAEYLIRLKDYQGMVYWSDFILTRGERHLKTVTIL